MAGVVEDDLDRVRLLGGELVALQHQQLGEALHRGQRAAQLVRGGEHELVFHPVEAVAFAGPALQVRRHLVEGRAERRRLREAADRDAGAQVAGRQPAGGLDELLQRPAHRGDQAAEEQRGAGQPRDQPGADQQGRVAGLAVDVVAEATAACPARRGWSLPPRPDSDPAQIGCGRGSRFRRSAPSRSRSPGAAGGSGRRRSPRARSGRRRRWRTRSSAGWPTRGSAASRVVVHMLAPTLWAMRLQALPTGSTAPRVEAWFAANVPGRRAAARLRADRRRPLEPDLPRDRFRRAAWALRRPPLGKRLGSAHDMSREHRVVSALAATPVPVAPVVGLCEDESVNGAPFYVMEFVEGPSCAGWPRRRPSPTTATARRSPSASSTRWSTSTRSTPTPPASASSARRRTTWPASCTAGRVSGRSRRRASCRWSTRSTSASRRRFPSRARRRSSTATTASTT